MVQIKFGTSGWRGIIADEFTFNNLKAVSQAIAEYVRQSGEDKEGIIVGYDCRFMGKTFAGVAASVLAANGIKALVSDMDVPTPTISWAIINGKADGAINITASHNPPEYTGVKYSSKWGGPALPDTTGWIGKRATEIVGTGEVRYLSEAEARKKGLWIDVNLARNYLDGLAKKIDFSVIQKRGGMVVYDPLFSTGRGYLDRILVEHGIAVTMIHDNTDPLFGGKAPDPSESRLEELSTIVRNDTDAVIGLATDGDADRFGIVDKDGQFIEPNYIIALLLDYLVSRKGYKGGAARSVATTHLIDAVARYHGIECFETPVGFKYIGEYIAGQQIAAGGEESAGFSIMGHVPEKDGIIACLLALEMVCRENKTIRELLDDLYRKVGTFRTRRDNLRLTDTLNDAFAQKIAAGPTSFAGISIVETITIDGTKYVLADGSWILFRKSGTEPVVRIYGEAADDGKLERLMKSGIDFITTT